MARIIGCLQKNKLILVVLMIVSIILIVMMVLYTVFCGMSTRKLTTHCSYDNDVFPEEKIFVNDGTRFGFRQFPGDDDQEKVKAHTTEFRGPREANEFIEGNVESSIHIGASGEDNHTVQQGVDEVEEGNEVIGLNDPLVSNQENQNDCVVLPSDGDSCASYQGVDKVEEGDEVGEPVISLGCDQESHNDSIVFEKNECGNALTPNDNVSFFRSSFENISESKFSVHNVDDDSIVYDQEKFQSLLCESGIMDEYDPCEASRIIPEGRVMKLRDVYESYVQEAASYKRKLTEWESQHVHPCGKPESNKS